MATQHFASTRGCCPRVSVTGVLCNTCCSLCLCPCLAPCILIGVTENIAREVCCISPDGRVASDREKLRKDLRRWKSEAIKAGPNSPEWQEYLNFLQGERYTQSLSGIPLFQSDDDFKTFQTLPDSNQEELPAEPVN